MTLARLKRSDAQENGRIAFNGDANLFPHVAVALCKNIGTVVKPTDFQPGPMRQAARNHKGF